MANLKDEAVSRSALLNFNPAKIKVKKGLNARDLTTPENREHIEFLKASIRENGYMTVHPLEIFSEGPDVFVSDGHCRITAVHELLAEGYEIPTVPCVPEGKGVNDVDRILRQNTSNSGKRLTMVEEGYNVKRAINLGLTMAEVSRRIGKSQSYVAQLMDFQAAPAEVHNLVKEGKVSSTFAAETMRERPEDGAEILKAAVATAQAEGKAKATKKHSVLHEPIPRLTAQEQRTNLMAPLSESIAAVACASVAPVIHKPQWSRDEVKLVLNLANTALYENDLEPELQIRIERLISAMGG